MSPTAAITDTTGDPTGGYLARSSALVIGGQEIDRYTVAHAGAGMLLAAYGIPWWAALTAAWVWAKVSDHPAKRLVMTLPPTIDDRATSRHAVADILAVMLGFGLVKALPEHTSDPAGRSGSGRVGA